MQASSHGDSHALDPHHEELGFWRKYIISTDHKIIGLQYGITALLFMFFGLCLMAMMRWQLAYPGQAIPIVGKLLFRMLGPDVVGTDSHHNVGVMMPDLYNS